MKSIKFKNTSSLLGIMSVGILFAPMFAFAKTSETLSGVLGTTQGLLNIVVPILLALAFIYFVWGIINYIFAKEEEKKKTGKQNMIYGIIALFVIASVWGLIAILQNTFHAGSTQNVDVNSENIFCSPGLTYHSAGPGYPTSGCQ